MMGSASDLTSAGAVFFIASESAPWRGECLFIYVELKKLAFTHRFGRFGQSKDDCSCASSSPRRPQESLDPPWLPQKARKSTPVFLLRPAPGRAGAEKYSKKEASLCFSTVYIKDMEQNSGDSRGSIGFSRAGLRNISRR